MRPRPPKQSHALKIAERRRSARCCWGCCSDACADTPARSANGRARAWSRLLYDRGTIPSSAPARSYIRRMAEHGRAPPSVCQRYDSFISVGTFLHTANGRAQAFRPLLLRLRFRRLRGHDRSFCEWQSAGVPSAAAGDVVLTLTRTRPLVLRMAEHRRSACCC